MKGYTSGRDTNNNFNQHCQKHALITRHGKFRPFDTSSFRVDLTLHKFMSFFLLRDPRQSEFSVGFAFYEAGANRLEKPAGRFLPSRGVSLIIDNIKTIRNAKYKNAKLI